MMTLILEIAVGVALGIFIVRWLASRSIRECFGFLVGLTTVGILGLGLLSILAAVFQPVVQPVAHPGTWGIPGELTYDSAATVYAHRNNIALLSEFGLSCVFLALSIPFFSLPSDPPASKWDKKIVAVLLLIASIAFAVGATHHLSPYSPPTAPIVTSAPTPARLSPLQNEKDYFRGPLPMFREPI